MSASTGQLVLRPHPVLCFPWEDLPERRTGDAGLLLLREGPADYQSDAAGDEDQGQASRRPLPQKPSVLPEKLLARLWMARAGRRMRTTDGRKLRVLYPGRPAPGHGPDFRDAVIELDGRRVRGPVELHRVPSDWAAHGHSADPAYDDVVLHVVGEATGGGAPDMPTVAMDGSEPDIALDHDAPGLPLARLGEMNEAELRAALRRAGTARFRERTEAATEYVTSHGGEQVLYAGVMEALGYSENRAPFAELAWRLPAALLRSAALAFPAEHRPALLRDLLASASGLEAPSQVWLSLGGTPPMGRNAWRLAGVRPSNHPVRRMGAAAVLLAAAVPRGLAPTLAAACLEGPPALVCSLRAAPATASSQGGGASAALGEQRAREVAVNAVLPVLLAWAKAKRYRTLARACLACYQDFPALGDNTVTREARRLLGERGAKLRLSACEHQGLMRLYRRAVAGR